MTEIETLRFICWVGVLVSMGAVAFTVIPLATANGTRPLLLVFSLMAIAMFIGACFLLFITYDIDQINSTGVAEVGVFYLRIKPILIGAALIWLGWRLRKAQTPHVVSGPATVTMEVNIEQVTDDGEVTIK